MGGGSAIPALSFFFCLATGGGVVQLVQSDQCFRDPSPPPKPTPRLATEVEYSCLSPPIGTGCPHLKEGATKYGRLRHEEAGTTSVCIYFIAPSFRAGNRLGRRSIARPFRAMDYPHLHTPIFRGFW